MAKTNFQIFNEENTPERTYNDSEYKEATQRVGGVMPGMALSRMHNKMYYQWSAMCKAIANLIVSHGHDCMDNDVEGITRYLEEAITSAATGGINTHRTASELDHPEKSVRKKHLHPDAYESPALTGTPTTPTAGKGTNNGQIASTAFVAQEIAALVNSAPGTLDTLQELAAALGNDANFATTVTNALAGKVSKSGDTMTGALKFDRINVACLIGSLLDGNAWRVFNGHGNAHTGFLAFDITNEDTEGIFLRKFNKDFSREIIAATLLDRENNTAFPGVVSAAGGFTGNLKGTASNANNLGNKSLQWIIDQINAAKTGIVASNLAQNGWVKFANGLIVQWGVGTEVSGAQQFDIALPIAFQNACFSVSVTVIQSRGVGSNYGEGFQVIEYNSDKIKLYLQHFELNSKPAKPLYIAIGV